MAALSSWPPKPMASSALLVDSRLLTAVCTRALTDSITLKRSNLSQPFCRACKALGFRCSASKGRGFGPEPVKKKVNNPKTQKESIQVASDTSKFVFGAKKRTQLAPELNTGVDSKSGNAVLDRQFLEKVEAVRRSALERKKSEEVKVYQAIDYDAPIEPEQSTIGFGTKVGIGIAVVVFGLVFALGDFIPSSSVQPTDDAAVVGKKLTDKERATLTADLQRYEATLVKSPEDPIALEGAAVTLAELGEFERASLILEKLTKKRPNDVEAYRLLGEVKFALKDFEGSASAYRRALSISDGINFEVLRGLTNSLLSAKKPNEAVDVLLSFRDHLNNGIPEASDVLTAKHGEPEQNIQEVDPIQVDLLLGKAYSDWGHVSDAVAVYDQLISKYPNDFRGYLAKGIILKENGKVGDAERMFIQAKFFAPEKAKALVDRYSRK